MDNWMIQRIRRGSELPKKVKHHQTPRTLSLSWWLSRSDSQPRALGPKITFADPYFPSCQAMIQALSLQLATFYAGHYFVKVILGTSYNVAFQFE